MIRDENGMMAGYVYVDMTGTDLGGYVATAKRAVRDRLPLPPGYSLEWSSQFENMLRVRDVSNGDPSDHSHRFRAAPECLWLSVLFCSPCVLGDQAIGCVSGLQYLHRGLGGGSP
jgi:hypothetical protein